MFRDSVPIAFVKSFLPLLLIACVGLSACTTLSNRRDLFRPAEPDGPYTKALKTGEMPSDKAKAE